MFSLPTAVSITDIQQENYRTKTFTLDATLEAMPGQFVMVWAPSFDEKPFSLVCADPVTLMVTAVGPFSHLMHERQIGDKVWIRGPFGQGFQVVPTQRRIVLVGGGYGVAPLYWLAQKEASHMDQITTIIGARVGADVLYQPQFEQLIAATTSTDISPTPNGSDYVLHVTTEDGSQGTQGRVTDALRPLAEARQVDGIYACGPHGMLEALRQLGQQYQIPCQLSWEAYMRCGIGICGACEHEGQVLCMDGPVLKYDAMKSDTLNDG